VGLKILSQPSQQCGSLGKPRGTEGSVTGSFCPQAWNEAVSELDRTSGCLEGPLLTSVRDSDSPALRREYDHVGKGGLFVGSWCSDSS
jgi:hypothetical protein